MIMCGHNSVMLVNNYLTMVIEDLIYYHSTTYIAIRFPIMACVIQYRYDMSCYDTSNIGMF